MFYSQEAQIKGLLSQDAYIRGLIGRVGPNNGFLPQEAQIFSGLTPQVPQESKTARARIRVFTTRLQKGEARPNESKLAQARIRVLTTRLQKEAAKRRSPNFIQVPLSRPR